MRIGWELLGWFLIRWKLAEYCTQGNCRRWELGECWTWVFRIGENWVSIAFRTIRGDDNWMSIGLLQFQLVRIGWALDFGSFNWWELGEHWTLTIWTGENWVSIGFWQFELVRIGSLNLEPFEVVRIEWTMEFKFNILEMWWLVIEGCRPHKISDRDSRERF